MSGAVPTLARGIDLEIHSTTWEWDMAGLSSQWRYSHFEGLHAMLDQSAVAVGDVGKSLRDLTVAVEKIDQRIEEFWPGG